MAFKTNLKDLRPARERYSKEVVLLSNGFADPKAFPEGKIKVFPWDSAVDDWIAKRVRKGNVKGKNLLFQILPQVCDLNGAPVGGFIASEVMAILMISRAIIRNNEIVVTPKCPECGHQEEGKIKIPDDLERVGEKSETYAGVDLVTMPSCKDVVGIKMLTIDDEIAVTDRKPSPRMPQIPDHVARVVAGIVSINDGKADSVIEYVNWFQALDPADAEYLIVRFDELQPQLSTQWEVDCGECGKEYSHVIQLDEDFFRRPGAARNRGEVAVVGNDGLQGKGTKP
jgi:hypothetical protein